MCLAFCRKAGTPSSAWRWRPGATLLPKKHAMASLTSLARTVIVQPWVRWLALLALCAAYLQGGLDKAFGFGAAVAELQHFGLAPAAPLAILTIALEIGASLLVLGGF